MSLSPTTSDNLAAPTVTLQSAATAQLHPDLPLKWLLTVVLFRSAIGALRPLQYIDPLKESSSLSLGPLHVPSKVEPTKQRSLTELVGLRKV